MKAGKEMDVLVAEKVMGFVWDESRCRICGWALYETVEQGCTSESCCERPAPRKRADEPGPFSTDIRAAWQVIEKSNGWLQLTCNSTQKMWAAHFMGMDVGVSGDTAPHAICLAALKAVGL